VRGRESEGTNRRTGETAGEFDRLEVIPTGEKYLPVNKASYLVDRVTSVPKGQSNPTSKSSCPEGNYREPGMARESYRRPGRVSWQPVVLSSCL
jgi:hypothetical protein